MNNLDSEILITNIQRFSLHDGPGIRTTIFLKGCSIHCPWCSNPENIKSNIECYNKNNKVYTFGYFISLKKLYEIILLDLNYYANDGGVTFSGGEPLLFFNEIEPLLFELKKANINICIETSLYCDKVNLNRIIPYLNNMIVDVKILDEELVKKHLGGNLFNYYSNFDYISKSKIIPQVRFPLIKGFTTNIENIFEIAKFLNKYNIKEIELLNGHNLAENKYLILKKTMYHCEELSQEEKEITKQVFNSYGIKTLFCDI